ncbi:PKD domain-containing protein [Fulvivirga sp. M361]|uniref:PKD domain-containing protein n=1 Tax=Fulvivirga sp. M361 TaxID=2594266 RepID=UPI00117B0D9B|nr:PKD domain-containing protein [Fulvivirga sp. M361]TRX62071.1 PKD domain-containing protein [Fulvivirga sp. M361]
MLKPLSLFVFVALISLRPSLSYSQCNSLRPQISIDFDTDQDCAPVTVTDFTITYFFNTAQNPADIEIRFEWNDPGNTIDVINTGNGLASAVGNTEFTASAPPFTYSDNNGQCTIIPTAFIYINGVLCPTSEEIQTAFFWGTDEQANAQLFINPGTYDVCYNNPVTNAVFVDNSEFNCNINVEPDRPNEQARHVQFVYGTNHNAAATIRDLSLQDGGTQPLTNGTGGLVTPQTRGTAGMPVTGGYFGPIETVPFPANAPISQSFPMNAPANMANAVGNQFEITLFNWNICNPWNGNTANPNYEDAVMTTAYITIVDAPDPDFLTREDNAAGDVTDIFCIGQTIYFDNETTNTAGLGFTWEFYDDATGTILLNTSNNNNPTFIYNTSGQKFIRLIAENPTAQGSCIESFERVIMISPTMVAQIGITDLSNNPIYGLFCQDASNLQSFDVRLGDISTGMPNTFTQWRWEFYNENNLLVREEPAAGAFSSTILGPFDQSFNGIGVHRVRIIIRDDATDCETVDEVEIIIYENPVADFTATRVCEGQLTRFEDASVLNAVNGETIILWEWDFDYDGVTFNKDGAFDNQTSFDRLLTPADTLDVALRITTDQNVCTHLVIKPVIVDPMPLASISANQANGCSVLDVTFVNNSVGNQPDIIQQYIWEVDDGSGFVIDSVQSPSDPGFSSLFVRSFENFTSANLTYQVQLRSVTVNNCETIGTPVNIVVEPGPRSGFSILNYSPFDDNCSPVSVDFEVDAETIALSPVSYIWTINDNEGLVNQQNTGTIPTYTYNFVNDTTSVKDFSITLTSVLANGCSSDSTRQIRVNPVPPADFTIDTLHFDCEIMQLNMEAITKGLSEYAWELKVNGVTIFSTTTEGDSFERTFNKAALDQNIEISLQATNLANCQSNLITQSIVVPAREVINASFNATPLVQTLPDRTVFINNTTNAGPWSYEWDFGDGNTSTDPDVSEHTFDTFGTYIITLTVTNEECVEKAVTSIIINPIPPIVDFDYAPPFGCAPLTVQFTNLSQFADSASYFWSFGLDEGKSRAVNPTYTYFEPGIYTVSLGATNILGDTVRETKPLIIEVFEKPVAQFDVRPFIVLIPDQPLFTNNNSFGATSFLWDFGDGTQSTEPEPRHFYKQEGIYDITLIATSSNGCMDTTRKEGVVQAKAGGRVLIPNAFTPNLSASSGGQVGNGVNDIFLPLTQGVAEFEMLVFNRWGELLFSSVNKNVGWDGYYNGKLCPQDVYVYKLNLVFENGEQAVRTGDVNLIR